MADALLSPAEFAQRIKAQYPVYANVPDADLAAKMLEKYPEYRDRVQPVTVASRSSSSTKEPQSSIGGLATVSAGQLIPRVGSALTTFAEGPTAPATIGGIARGLTTVGGIGHGIWTGNPSEVIMSPIAGWQAGKGGYFLGKGMQAVAKPIANAAEAIAPYAKGALSTLGSAQMIGDLAQIAEPTRKDIGVLGIGFGDSHPSDPAHPALINAAVNYLLQHAPQWLRPTATPPAPGSLASVAK